MAMKPNSGDSGKNLAATSKMEHVLLSSAAAKSQSKSGQSESGMTCDTEVKEIGNCDVVEIEDDCSDVLQENEYHCVPSTVHLQRFYNEEHCLSNEKNVYVEKSANSQNGTSGAEKRKPKEHTEKEGNNSKRKRNDMCDLSSDDIAQLPTGSIVFEEMTDVDADLAQSAKVVDGSHGNSISDETCAINDVLLNAENAGAPDSIQSDNDKHFQPLDHVDNSQSRNPNKLNVIVDNVENAQALQQHMDNANLFEDDNFRANSNLSQSLVVEGSGGIGEVTNFAGDVENGSNPEEIYDSSGSSQLSGTLTEISTLSEETELIYDRFVTEQEYLQMRRERGGEPETRRILNSCPCSADQSVPTFYCEE